jgi:hypothetical protein
MTKANRRHRTTTLLSQNNLKKRKDLIPHATTCNCGPTVGSGPVYGPTIHSHEAMWAPSPHGPTRQNW